MSEPQLREISAAEWSFVNDYVVGCNGIAYRAASLEECEQLLQMMNENIEIATRHARYWPLLTAMLEDRELVWLRAEYYRTVS